MFFSDMHFLLAEIDLTDARIVGDLVRRAFHQHPAAHQMGLFGDAKPEPAKKRSKLDVFIAKQGGRDALCSRKSIRELRPYFTSRRMSS